MSRSALTLALVAFAVCAAESARAETPALPPNVAVAFGNTVVSVYPDGRSQKVWFQPDGTWTGLSRKGMPLSGHWMLKGDKVCLRQTKPPTLPISFCQTIPADMTKGMDSHDVLGTPIHLKLVKGVAEAPG
ncbi:MAG: hypothetical protein JSR98_16605 [Proteobacteria bacterium]|nr:hypothetical protein [Pseudomonadota bacterium]